MTNTELTYTETNYLYDKFSNDEYKPTSSYVISKDFVPHPILVNKEFIETPEDVVEEVGVVPPDARSL